MNYICLEPFLGRRIFLINDITKNEIHMRASIKVKWFSIYTNQNVLVPRILFLLPAGHQLVLLVFSYRKSNQIKEDISKKMTIWKAMYNHLLFIIFGSIRFGVRLFLLCCFYNILRNVFIWTYQKKIFYL